jgi:hypothetical protein
MRNVEAMAKCKITDVTTDAALAQQMVIYLALRRRGVECSWDDAADIGLDIVGDDADPFVAASSLISPLSAVSGD